MWVAAMAVTENDSDVLVTKYDPARKRVFKTTFGGSSSEQVSGLAVDGEGNVVITGFTGSTDFPVRNAIFPKIPYTERTQSFVVKLSPAGAILFATYFGGTGTNMIFAVTVDSRGDIYLAGDTNAPDFPVTPGALQKSASGPSSFVSKLSSEGDRLLYSTYFGKVDHLASIAVDLGGNAYLTGMTASSDFPTTPEAPETSCRCDSDNPAAFAAKLNTTGSALVYGTYLGGAAVGRGLWGLSVSGIAVDSAGSAYVTGWTQLNDFPTTRGAFQTRLAGPPPSDPDGRSSLQDVFITKIDPGGTSWAYSTLLGGPNSDFSASIAVDRGGRATVTGYSNLRAISDPADFPITRSGALYDHGTFVSTLDASGSALVSSTMLPAGVGVGLTLDQVSVTRPIGYLPYLMCYDYQPSSSPSIIGVANSAVYQVVAKVSPGGLVSIFGFGIGPDQPASFQLDSAGIVPTTLAGVRVFFDEIAAPVLYAQANQINAVVPFGVASRSTVQLRVEYGGILEFPLPLEVVSTDPAIFLNNGSAAALNQDNTINSPQNPAARGSIVVLYGTGAGVLSPAGEDGRPAMPPFAKPELPVSVLNEEYNGFENVFTPLEVLYAGAAPGMVAGVIQINVRLPDRLSRFSLWALRLKVGDVIGPGVVVASKGIYDMAEVAKP
jgi:uncharacterized protein (TIGR03437 family)